MAFKHAHGSDDPRAGLWEVEGHELRQTSRAILFSDGVREAWLPKRSIKIEPSRGGCITVAMPDWLAREKGYV